MSLIKEYYAVLQNRKETINALLFISFLFLPLIIRPIKDLTGWNWIIWPLTLLFIITSVFVNNVYKKKKYYVVFSMFIILMILNLVLVPYKNEALIIFTEIIKYSAIAFFLGMPAIDYKKMAKYWYVLGILTLFIFTFEIPETRNSEISYMFFGISIVLAYGGIFYRIIRRRKWYDLLLGLYATIIVTLLGSRGALLTIIAITVVLSFLYLKRKGRMILVGSGLITLALYFSGLLKMILNMMNDLLMNLGLNSRTIHRIIEQMEQGLAAASSGRDRITVEAIEMIKKAGFMPMGIGYYQSQTRWLYPHNIFLEMMIIFGIFSIPIIAGIIFATYRFYRRETDPVKKDMVTLLMIISVTRLLLSDTFLTYTPFWMWMVLVLKDDLDGFSKKLLAPIRNRFIH